LIDLHTHTKASDGTYSPAELIDAACNLGLEALAITDHDTFDGYDEALPRAQSRGLPLVCGIELSTNLPRTGGGRSRTVHLLAYFFGEPPANFRKWLCGQQQIRRERNIALVSRLNALGVDITLEEVRTIGKNMTGRPHFARVLLRKGYVSNFQEAFDRYLGEQGIAYVEKHDPSLEEAITAILSAGGIASLAHPVRIDLPRNQEKQLIARLREIGMQAIEVHHSDHSDRHRLHYSAVAAEYGLLVTGGSDFHGDNKPDVDLGTGRGGNVVVPPELLRLLREAART
jgi:predicted metal-dependent phosphoesterase TrpH